MKLKLQFIICLVLFIIPGISSGNEYTLDDLYRLALARSETIKISEEDIYISEREKDRAMAVLLPTLSAFGNHTRYTDAKRGTNTQLQPDYTNEWGVRLDQSLSLSGRELTALKIAKQGIKKSAINLDAVKEEYLLKIASAYYDVMKSKKALEISMANVARLTKHRDASKIRLEVGEVTKTVVLRAEAELAGSLSEKIRSDNRLRLAKSVLARTAGINGDYEIKESPSEKISANSEPSLLKTLSENCRLSILECLKDKAIAERAEINALTIEKEVVENELKYARGSYWPDLSIEGVYLRREDDPLIFSNLDERIYGALKLNFPFFEGGLRAAEVSQAKAKLRQAEQSLMDRKKSVDIEIEDSYLNLMTVMSINSYLQSEVTYAMDNFNAVTKQFQYGLADSIDVIDANTLLVTSEKELANSEYDYQLAVIKLRRAAGVLLKTVAADQASVVILNNNSSY